MPVHGFMVVCQVCGHFNEPDTQFCAKCTAPLQIRLQTIEEEEQREAALRRLPPEIEAKARELETLAEKDPTKTAPLIQLSNLYYQYKIKDRAVDYLERAIAIDPDNKYLRQKLDLIVGRHRASEDRIAELVESQRQANRWARVVGIAVVLLLLAGAGFAVKMALFPSSYRVAYTKDNVTGLRFSPDGRRIAYLSIPKYGFMDLHPVLGQDLKSIDSELVVADLDGDDPRTVTRFASFGYAYEGALEFTWIPNTDEIAYTAYADGEQIIRAVGIDDGESRDLATGFAPTFSHDGRYMAYLAPPPAPDVPRDWRDELASGSLWRLLLYSRGDELSLYVKELAGGEPRIVVENSVSNAQFNPRANVLVYEKKADVSAAGADSAFAPLGQDAESWAARFSDLDVVSSDIYTYDLATSTETRITADNACERPRWTPDGEKIVFNYYPDPKDYRNFLYWMNADGTGRHMLLGNRPEYESFGRVSFSPDGSLLAFEAQFVNPDRPEMPTQMTPIGMVGGGPNLQNDIFVLDVERRKMHRLTDSRHKFKSNPHFHPTKYKLAYEISRGDGRREAWITNVDR